MPSLICDQGRFHPGRSAADNHDLPLLLRLRQFQGHEVRSHISRVDGAAHIFSLGRYMIAILAAQARNYILITAFFGFLGPERVGDKRPS
ncbi:hypothetical protein D3C77_539510 [compost metagenome]